MDTPNPLKFFIDLAEEMPFDGLEDEPKATAKPIKPLDCKLSDEDYDLLFDFSFEEPIKSDPKPLGGHYDLGESYYNYWDSSYFSFNLPSKLNKEKTDAIQAVDTVLAGMADIGTAFSKLTELVTSIDTAISKLNTYEDVKRYPAILNTYNDLKVDLNNRKKRLIQPAQADQDKKKTPAKIQWVGQVNILGTLFYHLLKGQDGGAPYISASVEQVKRMLADNFIDHEGYDLSKATLDTIFTPSRSEKRANVGDRIELPNKKARK